MVWKSSCLVCSILCFLTLDRNHVLSEITCQPGEKATKSRDGCIPCPDGQYNNKHSQIRECRNCDPCELNSFEVTPCRPKQNTECRCNEGFKGLDKTQKRCICPKGSGIKNLGNWKEICEKCPPKTFSNQTNSKCQPLPEYGEKIPGSTTSDVNYGTKAKTVVAPSSPFPLPITSNSTPTMNSSRNSISTPTISNPKLQDNKNHALCLASVTAFLLFILILKLSRCCRKKTKIIRQGSACGKPVEESGEKFLPPV
ncbi:tumor necrosis factor receptor superfamily member 1B [Silurus meridionalis]|uniref:tumor necrosis factor receptor superfamily member 1B n=1 Tax=Silurus meridionalis TaxID=175797 RepID=UPI001EEBCE74|nr:tumor necrosis factor receptor superfamily member 1B [Silurus meridionalis]